MSASWSHIDLVRLRGFISNSGVDFPVAAAKLALAARQWGGDKTVVSFLASIDPQDTLRSAEEVLTRAEEASLLQAAKAQVPFFETLEWEED